MKSLALLLLWLGTYATFVLSKEVKQPLRPSFVRNALSQGQNLYYFGLGSNMLRSKIENRGVNGTKIDLISIEPAQVNGHRLAFNMRGFPPLEPGMGSLEPYDSKNKPIKAYHSPECHGALVLVTSENYEKIMRSEGVADDVENPGYEEIVVDAYPYKSPTTPVKAIVLRARSHVRLSRDPAPSLRYMTILREGAAELGLKPCYQDFLANHPIEQPPLWLRRLAVDNMIFTFTVSRTLKSRVFSQIQSRLLFLFYHPAAKRNVLKSLSDVASAIVLLPGAVLGKGMKAYYKISKKEMPMFLTRMVQMLDDTSPKNNEHQQQKSAA